MLTRVKYEKLYSRSFINKYKEIDALVNTLNQQIGLPLYQTRVDLDNKEIVVEDYFESLTNSAIIPYKDKMTKKTFRGIYG